MRKLMLVLMALAFAFTSAVAQYGYDPYDDYNGDYRNDRYYYDDQFDWHWDARVRISEGIRSGLITNWEANRLYRDLERIERLEYNYAADGYFSPWEQDEIWREVRFLNRRIGLELTDYDRRFYGFFDYGRNIFPFWFDRGGYDFYRFDKRGWGTMRGGYYSRNYVPRNYNNRRYGNNGRYNDRNWNNNRRNNDNDQWNQRQRDDQRNRDWNNNRRNNDNDQWNQRQRDDQRNRDQEMNRGNRPDNDTWQRDRQPNQPDRNTFPNSGGRRSERNSLENRNTDPVPTAPNTQNERRGRGSAIPEERLRSESSESPQPRGRRMRDQ